MKQDKHGDARGKSSREFNELKVKAFRQFYMYPKGYGAVIYVDKSSQGITICNHKGHRSVSPMPMMNIRSNYRNRGSRVREYSFEEYYFWQK